MGFSVACPGMAGFLESVLGFLQELKNKREREKVFYVVCGPSLISRLCIILLVYLCNSLIYAQIAAADFQPSVSLKQLGFRELLPYSLVFSSSASPVSALQLGLHEGSFPVH